jgi:O-antigen ligase
LDDIKTPQKLEGYVIACISSGLIWSAVGLGLFASGNTTLMVQDTNLMYRLSSLNGDANFFASILVGWLPLAFYGLVKRDNNENLFYLLACVVMTAAIVFTYSRGAYLALAVEALFILFIILKYGYRLGSVLNMGKTITAFTIGILIVLIILTRIASVGSRVASIEDDKTGGSGRLSIWVDVLHVALMNPLGVGLGNLTNYTLRHRSEYKTAGSEAHNVFLNIVAETGFLGLMAYLFFIATIMQKFFIIEKYRSSELLYSFLSIYTGMLGIAITMIFLSNVYNENIFVQGALLLSISHLDRTIGTGTENMEVMEPGL